MNTVFLNGWGFSSAEAKRELATANVPGDIAVLELNPSDVKQAEALSGDLLIAYSTGAFLVLKNTEILTGFDRVVLLAPFFDFKLEAARGGKIRKAQLKYLLRWLRNDPLAAVNDFRQRGGILREPLQFLPTDSADLIWGIEQLLEGSVDSTDVPPNVEGLLGREDSLLEHEVLSRAAPWMRIVPHVGHDLGALLTAVDFEK